MFGGSSQLPTTAEHYFVVWTVPSDLITARSAIARSWNELPNIWLTVAKNTFVGWALHVRVRVLLKIAVTKKIITGFYIISSKSSKSKALNEVRISNCEIQSECQQINLIPRVFVSLNQWAGNYPNWSLKVLDFWLNCACLTNRWVNWDSGVLLLLISINLFLKQIKI